MGTWKGENGEAKRKRKKMARREEEKPDSDAVSAFKNLGRLRQSRVWGSSPGQFVRSPSHLFDELQLVAAERHAPEQVA